MKKFMIGICFSLFSITEVFAGGCYGVSCIPEKIKSNCVEEQEQGCIDWTNGIIYAVGYGIGPNYPSKHRAGKIDGMRNLLEMVKGVKMDSSTTVDQNKVVSDKVVAKAKGNLRWIQVVGSKDVKDDTIAVTVRMYMRNLWPVLLGKQEFENKNYKNKEGTKNAPKELKKKANEIYTGLIVDTRNHHVVPALSPKIVSPNGDEVYGSSYVDRSFATKQGMIGYAKTEEQAKSNKRIGDNPLIIKSIKKSGKNNADIVVSETDARLLEELGKKLSFLRETRVIVIVD